MVVHGGKALDAEYANARRPEGVGQLLPEVGLEPGGAVVLEGSTTYLLTRRLQTLEEGRPHPAPCPEGHHVIVQVGEELVGAQECLTALVEGRSVALILFVLL